MVTRMTERELRLYERDLDTVAVAQRMAADAHLLCLLLRESNRERWGDKTPPKPRRVTLATAPLLEREGEHEAR